MKVVRLGRLVSFDTHFLVTLQFAEGACTHCKENHRPIHNLLQNSSTNVQIASEDGCARCRQTEASTPKLKLGQSSKGYMRSLSTTSTGW